MRILALSHLWPKAPGDAKGVYIQQMYAQLAKRHAIRVLVPRAPDLVVPPPAPGTPEVVPFSYLVPEAWSTFGYGGGLTGDQRLSRSSLALAPLYGLAAAARVRRERAGVGAIHAHFLVPNGTLAAAAAGATPLVISLHGSDVYLAERSAVMRRAARYALARAAAVVPCSEDLATRVIALGADPARVKVIPYGADASLFSRGADASARAKRRGEIEAGARPLALFVGNLLPKKGVAHLVDAAARVVAKRPDALFVAIGDGPLAPDLKAQALARGLTSDHFRFLGAVRWADIPSWYAAADLFCCPSVVDPSGNVDGLPNVVLEAMASSLPVVASRVAGIPMAVRDGETGTLVAPGDDAALAAAIESLFADREAARRRGAAGRRLLETEMTWQRIADRYEALFASLSRSGERPALATAV